MDKYNKTYQNLLFKGDFDAITNEKCMAEFYNLNGLTSLIKKPTCFKNLDKSKCTELILTNQPCCFQNSNIVETGLSNLHLVTVTEFKMSFQKTPKIVNYWEYKHFGDEKT